MDYKNPRVPKLPIRVGGGFITVAATNSLYNVEGGHRAIVFNRLGGIKDKFSVCMHLDGSGTQISTSETGNTLSSGANASKLHVEWAVKSYPISEEPVAEELGMNESVPEQEVIASQKKTAKIHDFCLGIPFGGIVLSGGLVGSIFSRNLTTLGNGVFFGCGLLALSTFSLKVWRQGKSSLPFILGQAALAVVFLWKHIQNYSLTKKVFPAGFYAAISAAMLCFYSYVLASGGNPPPKKKAAAI